MCKAPGKIKKKKKGEVPGYTKQESYLINMLA